MGRLALVATPIGNLGDISERAAQCLRESDRVLAEDTRRTRALLSHLQISGKPLERLDAEIESRSLDRWLDRLEAGEQLALVSDAGTPGISDPGAALVRAAVEGGHTATPLPGPSAVVAALAASGFAAPRFRFFGFLPRGGAARREVLAELERTEEVALLFESPARMATTLRDIARGMPDRAVVVAREMSKLHEEFVRGTAASLLQREAKRKWQGELTVVLGPHQRVIERLAVEQLDERIGEMLTQGTGAKDASKLLALDSGWSAREVYRRIIDIRDARERREEHEERDD